MLPTDHKNVLSLHPLRNQVSLSGLDHQWAAILWSSIRAWRMNSCFSKTLQPTALYSCTIIRCWQEWTKAAPHSNKHLSIINKAYIRKQSAVHFKRIFNRKMITQCKDHQSIVRKREFFSTINQIVNLHIKLFGPVHSQIQRKCHLH